MTIPSSLVLTARLGLPNTATATAAVLAATGTVLPAPTSWRRDEGPRQAGRPDTERLPASSKSCDLHFDGGALAFIDHPPAARQSERPWCELRLHLPTASGYVTAVEHGAAIVRHLMHHGALTYALLDRENGGGGCLPRPPLVEHAVLTVISDQAAARFYDDVGAFQSVWEGSEEIAGRCLRLRAASAATGPDFVAAVLDGQWTLARAARAGATRHPPPLITPDEESVYRAQPGRLVEVGYIAPAGIVEYTCVARPGEHLAGWEIHGLAALVREARTVDRKPVTEVRVVFLERGTAEAEKRPLLDCGIAVLAMGVDGLPVAVPP